MAVTRSSFAEYFLDDLSAYFNIYPDETESPLAARCEYHVRDEKYVLTRKAQLWAAESNEYLYLFSMPHLSMENMAACRQMALDDGMERIHPHSQHMYSYITAVFLYDTADEDALNELKRYKKSVSFKLSLHGWMEYRIAAVDVSTANIVSNRRGREVKKSLKKSFKRLEAKNNIQTSFGEEKTK